MNQKRRCAICAGGTLQKNLLTITKPDRFERFVGISAKCYQRSWRECDQCGALTDVHDPRTQKKLCAIETVYYAIDFKNSSIPEKYKKVMSLPPEKSDNAQRVSRIHAFYEEWSRYFSTYPPPLLSAISELVLGYFLPNF